MYLWMDYSFNKMCNWMMHQCRCSFMIASFFSANYALFCCPKFHTCQVYYSLNIKCRQRRKIYGRNSTVLLRKHADLLTPHCCVCQLSAFSSGMDYISFATLTLAECHRASPDSAHADPAAVHTRSIHPLLVLWLYSVCVCAQERSRTSIKR